MRSPILMALVLLTACGGSSGSKALRPPLGVTATPGNAIGTIDWLPATRAATYNIYWSTTPGVTKATGTLIASVMPPHDHTGLTNGTTYHYVVTSARGKKESIESMEVSATPRSGPDIIIVHDNAAGGNGDDGGRSVAIDSAQRIVVGGYSLGSSDIDMVIWRYLPDGSHDTTFNTQGWFAHHGAAGNGDDIAYDIALDPSDGIFAAGTSQGPITTDDMALWHVDSTGTLDLGFGTGGVVSHDDAAGGSWHDRGYGVAHDPLTGRTYVTGQSHNGTSFDMVIWAYDLTGTLVPAFGTAGIVTHDGAAGANSTESGLDIEIDGTNRIIVAGHGANPRGNFDMVIWVYDATGTLDPTFGTAGIAVHDEATASNSRDWGVGLHLDPTDRILVAGYSEGGPDWEMVTWRYQPTGILDTTFATTGYAIHGGPRDDAGSAVTVDASSRIVVTGHIQNANPDQDMAIWRSNDDGTLDTTFATGGVFTHDGGTGDDGGYDVTIDPSGRIVVVGYSTNAAGDQDLVIWRHWP